MEFVACNCCGSARLRLVYTMPDPLFPTAERFNVMECQECGLGLVNPRPTREEMARYYPAEYYESFVEDRKYHHHRYAREASYLDAAPRTGPRPRLLDIGCANGDFPRFMRQRGWDIEGVEVSAAASPIDDFPVYREDLDTAPIGPCRYSAVTAWAVMEHIHDPAACFRKVQVVLQPGGVFVFLVTNFESMASRRLFAEDVPRHLHFFTESTVRRYLDRAGLRLERADYSDAIFAMPSTNWLPYLLHRVRRRPFTWEARRSYALYRRRQGLSPGLGALLRFGAFSPLALVDRALVPLIDRIQMRRRRYGIVTYVARKE
jgi:SAM-dependent methyltransferase